MRIPKHYLIAIRLLGIEKGQWYPKFNMEDGCLYRDGFDGGSISLYARRAVFAPYARPIVSFRGTGEVFYTHGNLTLSSIIEELNLIL